MTTAVKEALSVVIRLTAAIFAVELLIMLVLSQLPRLSPLAGGLVDALLLALLLAPALYLLVYRPLKRQTRALQQAHDELRASLVQQQELNRQLSNAQTQLLDSEKLVSMGQLAAGVAHEINNPVGFIGSNLGTLQSYVDNLLALLQRYEQCHPLLAEHPECFLQLQQARSQADIDFLKDDIRDLLKESQEGVDRVRGIVQDLKDFSRSDDGVLESADLNHELERTLNIVHNELKYHTRVTLELDPIPLVECVPAQINQVFLNILVNAGQAIEKDGLIRIRTEQLDDQVCISIADNGSGMTPEQQSRLFEPFYTTKPRGKGTGLGLSVSWGIIQKHGGRIEVESTPGQGSTFRIFLPLARTTAEQVRQSA